MAAKRVHADRQLIAVCGDIGVIMNSQALRNRHTAEVQSRRLGPPRWRLWYDQANMGLQNFGLRYGLLDFVMDAEV